VGEVLNHDTEKIRKKNSKQAAEKKKTFPGGWLSRTYVSHKYTLHNEKKTKDRGNNPKIV
jgi:hypothetical protein